MAALEQLQAVEVAVFPHATREARLEILAGWRERVGGDESVVDAPKMGWDDFRRMIGAPPAPKDG